MKLVTGVAAGVHRVTDAFTNWYLVEGDGGITVVDTGLPSSWGSLQRALGTIGRPLDDVGAVVLTHGHFDHLGFAERARTELGVPVWVHEDDVALTQHPLRYAHERPRSLYLATRPRALPIVVALTARRAWWPAPVRAVSRYRDGTLPVPGAPRVVPTPGHTDGHCSLHLPERDCVIAGDAVVTLDPYTGRRGPRVVARAATADSRRALESLDALAATGAATILVGHGDEWTQGAEAAAAHARRAGVA
ncbi:MAG TPA: MBL fold metallo-hydrolase [Actinomycetota bacterium]|nr:MBL fold metallo-hydrolase [Actinomycetota bacterium]